MRQERHWSWLWWCIVMWYVRLLYNFSCLIPATFICIVLHWRTVLYLKSKKCPRCQETRLQLSGIRQSGGGVHKRKTNNAWHDLPTHFYLAVSRTLKLSVVQGTECVAIYNCDAISDKCEFRLRVNGRIIVVWCRWPWVCGHIFHEDSIDIFHEESETFLPG